MFFRNMLQAARVWDMPHLMQGSVMELCFVFCLHTPPPNPPIPTHEPNGKKNPWSSCKQPFVRTNSGTQTRLVWKQAPEVQISLNVIFLMHPELPLILMGALEHPRNKRLSLLSVFPIISSKQHFVHRISRYEKHDCTVCIFTGNGCKI